MSESPSEKPGITRRDFLKLVGGSVASRIVPDLPYPIDAKKDKESEIKDALEKEINFHKQYRLDFTTPKHLLEEEIANGSFPYFILDEQDPIRALDSMPYADRELSLEMLAERAEQRVSDIELESETQYASPGFLTEKDFLQKYTRALPGLALFLPDKVASEPPIHRGTRAQKDRLTIDLSEYTPKGQRATNMMHENNHYVQYPDTMGNATEHFTKVQIMDLHREQLRATNKAFEELMTIDMSTVEGEEHVRKYFNNSYLDITPFSIEDLIRADYLPFDEDLSEIHMMYDSIFPGEDLYEIPLSIALMKTVQYFHQNYDKLSVSQQETYQAVAQRLYFDLHHHFTTFIPENSKAGFYDVYKQEESELMLQSPFFESHMKLARLRMKMFAGVDLPQDLNDEEAYFAIVDHIQPFVSF